MSNSVSYRPKTGEIPTSPGVYRFRDPARRILYVGKAKNLRARLSNYFAPLESLHERTRRMVTTASSVEWTVVGSEFEALQLEFSWIKEFNPPFNVQFRDDKSYPYLAITLAEDVPRVFITRNHAIKGARYFGPYTKVWAIRETLDLLLKVFPMRSCTDSVYRRAEQTGRPCLLGQIGKCAAPCVGWISREDHKALSLDFSSFMAGNDSSFLNQLQSKMKAAAAEQDYETAAKYRDQLTALETVLSKNSIVLPDSIDADLFGIADDELAAAVQLFIVRGGRIRGVRSWVLDKELDLKLPELVETVIQNAYSDAAGEPLVPPRLVAVPALPEDTEGLERYLSQQRQAHGSAGRVEFRVPKRGDLAQLAETVLTNAKSSLASYKTRRSSDFVARSAALSDIQEALGMAEAPLRMECFDISHLSGTNIVASMVVFEDGLPRKDLYRRFSIAESADDTESIYQTLSRRLSRLTEDPESEAESAETEIAEAPRKRFAYRPNLLIVDGGQPQVQAAARVFRELGIPTSGEGSIALCGIAKRLEEIWLPDSDFPVILPRNSDALFLIQRIRDEAHRFAITFQRKKRKADITSVLSEIPGLGPARVAELLRHFGSVKHLKSASAEDLTEVKGIGESMAELIHSQLHPDSSS
ncbi:MAG: excinuclease ABC subunit UvrC [Cryobacterium sp.]|nr:excinuclease ABC subunit UvrC [Cryobacterium sp.]MCO5293957.1 excinuclease ABC subunit UvrC [Homoserinimonas sp.]